MKFCGADQTKRMSPYRRTFIIHLVFFLISVFLLLLINDVIFAPQMISIDRNRDTEITNDFTAGSRDEEKKLVAEFHSIDSE